MKQTDSDLIDLAFLSNEIYEKRDGMSLREAAVQSGVSAATLCRVEQGRQIDVEGYAKLCKWLGVGLERYITTTKTRSPKPRK